MTVRLRGNTSQRSSAIECDPPVECLLRSSAIVYDDMETKLYL